MMTSVSKRVLYTGVSSDIEGRVWEHKNKVYPDCYTAKYNCILLVYYRFYESIEEAIAEEKRIKSLSRTNKERLINEMNPDWHDLSNDIGLSPRLD